MTSTFNCSSMPCPMRKKNPTSRAAVRSSVKNRPRSGSAPSSRRKSSDGMDFDSVRMVIREYYPERGATLLARICRLGRVADVTVPPPAGFSSSTDRARARAQWLRVAICPARKTSAKRPSRHRPTRCPVAIGRSPSLIAPRCHAAIAPRVACQFDPKVRSELEPHQLPASGAFSHQGRTSMRASRNPSYPLLPTV
jgi:hypothetical protein